ncbi:hypothetical protein LJR231_001524 [Phyllobacterium sp. LjRoot231]|uniref:hypothetical protein n=1 Tax=Phyllobacterium sp. LjRoot231 TaxID=3342289 RepID=UPI003ECD2229
MAAFSSGDDLVAYLTRAHGRIDFDRLERFKKERAVKLGLEDTGKLDAAALNWTDEEKRAMQPGPIVRTESINGRQLGIGKTSLWGKKARPGEFLVNGRKASPDGDPMAEQISIVDFSDVHAARHHALILIEEGFQRVTITDDTGHVINELTSASAAINVADMAPFGQYRLKTFTWSIRGPDRVPATEMRNEIFEDLEVARRAGTDEYELGYLAFIYDDQGKLVTRMSH